MIAKFRTHNSWRYFDGVQQAEVYDHSASVIDDGSTYDMVPDSTGHAKHVRLRLQTDALVLVRYDREAYLCTDRGETINAI